MAALLSSFWFPIWGMKIVRWRYPQRILVHEWLTSDDENVGKGDDTRCVWSLWDRPGLAPRHSIHDFSRCYSAIARLSPGSNMM